VSLPYYFFPPPPRPFLLSAIVLFREALPRGSPFRLSGSPLEPVKSVNGSYRYPFLHALRPLRKVLWPLWSRSPTSWMIFVGFSWSGGTTEPTHTVSLPMGLYRFFFHDGAVARRTPGRCADCFPAIRRPSTHREVRAGSERDRYLPENGMLSRF